MSEQTTAPADERGLVGDLRRTWSRQARQTAGNPYLTMLLIGSLLLSAASFYTTFNGMLDFMPVFPVTFCIVFAIQALLFVTSWRIGYALANREGLPILTVFVFLVCLSTSVFFSWVALFESINDAETQERTRTTRIHRAVEDAVSELQVRLVDQRRTQAEAMLASPGYLSWADSVEQVGDEAIRARSAIQAALDAEAEETAARIRELEARRAEILRGEAAEGERVASAERELARLEESRPPLVARVNDLRRQLDEARAAVVVKEGEMEAEETGGAAGSGVGRGPIWRGLRDERNVLAAQRDAIERLFLTAEAELTRADSRIEELRAEIAAAGATEGVAELAVIDQRIAALQAQLGDSGADGVTDLSSEVDAMRAELALFRSRLEIEPFDRAAARCETLLEAMRTRPELASRVATLSCDSSALTPYLSAIRVAQDGEARLVDRCLSGGGQSPDVSSLSFEESLAFGRGCVDVSGLPASAVADLRDRFGRLVLEEDPNSSQMVKTVNAFSDGDKLSYIALAIALFIDLLVLFSGLIGALTNRAKVTEHLSRSFSKRRAESFVNALRISVDDLAHSTRKDVVITRAILRAAVPSVAPRGVSGWSRRNIAARLHLLDIEDDDERWLVRQFMAKLVHERHAFVDDTTTGENDDQAFYLTANALDALREHLFNPDSMIEEQDEQAAEREERARIERQRAQRRRAAIAEAAPAALAGPQTDPDRLLEDRRSDPDADWDASAAASRRDDGSDAYERDDGGRDGDLEAKIRGYLSDPRAFEIEPDDADVEGRPTERVVDIRGRSRAG